jgi:hypothetical protein
MAQSDKEWFAVIGAIIVKWGAIEKMVATSIHQIETEVAVAKGITPVYTDLRSFRDFKARKGYLRKLFEQHAQKDELAMLDTIYQALTDPGRVRHALGHDIVAIQAMTGQLGIIKHGNPARGTPTETTWKTFEELVATIKAINGIPDGLARLTISMTLRIGVAGKNLP